MKTYAKHVMTLKLRVSAIYNYLKKNVSSVISFLKQTFKNSFNVRHNFKDHKQFIKVFIFARLRFPFIIVLRLKMANFTCLSCSVRFADGDMQRNHFGSDWHRYDIY